jgi:2-polyprenyl-6-methoxyphenol hydroxylase-like FAD-dependent oxidoreductase
MHVGVLGGDLQGCCIALALADRGIRVTLFDKNNTLLSRAAVANEGKIHLGYMYAGDPTLSTAKTMMTGALSFASFLERHVSLPSESPDITQAAVYLSNSSFATSRSIWVGYGKLAGFLYHRFTEPTSKVSCGDQTQ